MPSGITGPRCSGRVDVDLSGHVKKIQTILVMFVTISCELEFSKNLHPGRSFSKAFCFSDLKIWIKG